MRGFLTLLRQEYEIVINNVAKSDHLLSGYGTSVQHRLLIFITVGLLKKLSTAQTYP